MEREGVVTNPPGADLYVKRPKGAEQGELGIKYRLDHVYAPPQRFPGLARLNAWRTVLHRLGLIGQDPARYGGLGYGNLSQRLKDETFLVTATQTGHLAHLEPEHYVRVLWASPEDNALRAEGPAPPSSEALTHAALYAADARIRFVIHVHCPEIWRQAERLCLAVTAPDCAYGTPELAGEVSRMAAASGLPGLLVMGGHEDGILVFGAELSPTAGLLIDTLAEALS